MLPAVSGRNPSGHLGHVDGLRALAALAVLLNHSYAQIWNGGRLAPEGPLLAFGYFMTLGHAAVAVFIVLSGFCLMLPVVRAGGGIVGGASSFLRRRARRILPPYYAALTLSLLLIWTVIGEPTGTVWDVAIAIRSHDLISHLILTQDVFGTGRINYAFWSIATEVQIYLLFPALVWLWYRAGATWAMLVTTAGAYTTAWLLAGTRGGRAQTHFVALFALGMLAAAVSQMDAPKALDRWRHLPWRALTMASAVAFAGLVLSWGWLESTHHFPLLDGLVGVATCGLLVMTAPPEGGLRRVLQWRPLVALGTFSYSLYLVHAPLLQVIWVYVLQPWRLSREMQFLVVLGAGLPMIVACSYLFHLVCERPFMTASSLARTRPRIVPTPDSRALPHLPRA